MCHALPGLCSKGCMQTWSTLTHCLCLTQAASRSPERVLVPASIASVRITHHVAQNHFLQDQVITEPGYGSPSNHSLRLPDIAIVHGARCSAFTTTGLHRFNQGALG